ncbi:hypothetical protein GQ44DRAFT_12466 [Phaeosphaeriaceae sp. PMI808]|nr:hypothetical protein GQ44DRAFT_12466 [Phaeosphaeriaceae sp. PMI808]
MTVSGFSALWSFVCVTVQIGVGACTHHTQREESRFFFCAISCITRYSTMPEIAYQTRGILAQSSFTLHTCLFDG